MKLNRLTVRKDRLERLRKICLALPEATEKVTWGDPMWRIGHRPYGIGFTPTVVSPCK